MLINNACYSAYGSDDSVSIGDEDWDASLVADRFLVGDEQAAGSVADATDAAA